MSIVIFFMGWGTAIPQMVVHDPINWLEEASTAVSTEYSKIVNAIQTSQFLTQFAEGVGTLQVVEQILEQFDALACAEKQLSANLELLKSDYSCFTKLNISGITLQLHATTKLIGYLYGYYAVSGAFSKSGTSAAGVTEGEKVNMLNQILKNVTEAANKLQALNFSISNATMNRYQRAAVRKQKESGVVLYRDYAPLKLQ